MVVSCKVIKQVYANKVSGYKVLSCIPDDNTDCPNLKLNKYGNFTLSGNNLGNINVGTTNVIDIELDEGSKYPASYILTGFSGLSAKEGRIYVEPDAELRVLQTIMQKSQAKYVNEAYPDFVSRVLNDEQATIDFKKIYNVGEYRLHDYISKIKQNCRNILLTTVAVKYGIKSNNDINKLAKYYAFPEVLDQCLANSPYVVFCDQIDWKFTKADKQILSNDEVWRTNKQRCLYAIISILQDNEEEGDTRLNKDIVKEMVEEIAPESANTFDEAVQDEKLYYDTTTDTLALFSTYSCERTIADNIIERIKNPRPCPMDWTKFKQVDGMELTDEQCKILQMAGQYDVMMLTGPAGCVDCDTEFFTGTEWKRIADYAPNDKVLQYNEDGTAELVYPISYIKVPCNSLWHFETKYGVNQTVCDEHRIVYWSQKGCKHECNIQEIIDKQNGNGWTGRFATTFKYNGAGIDLTDEQIRIMCAVICDGSFYNTDNEKRKSYKTCRFHIKKERKKERLRLLFEQAGVSWREVESTAPGYTDLYIEAPMRIKEFTPEWYQCSNHQLQVICDEIIFWDGSVNSTKKGTCRKRFSTAVKATADFVQFAFSACGIRASILTNDRSGQKYFTCGKWYTRKSVEYNVSITDRIMVGICADNRENHHKTQITQTPTTDGYKYCFTVPSHMLVLRRKGCVFITGNCGKTSSTRALIRMLEANNHSYTLLAPTGVAAKMLRQSTGREAMTVNLFLVTHGFCGEYLILDEASMLSVHLLGTMFNYLSSENYYPKIIFICDPAQLASVSCGNVVQNIIDSSIVPIANLTKVFRYGEGGIATTATDIRLGNDIDFSKQYIDSKFISEEDDIFDAVLDEYKSILAQGYKQNEVLILSPFNKGEIGTIAINEVIQEEMNPNPFIDDLEVKHGKFSVRFKKNDLVINIHNNYHATELEIDEFGEFVPTDEPCSIVNGDIGRIVKRLDSGDKAGLIVDFNDKFVWLVAGELSDLLLGYAISCHKSQGNQSPAIILIVDHQHKALLTRNLCYVGVSRAQKYLCVIGQQETLNQSLTKEENMERDTNLGDMLKL